MRSGAETLLLLSTPLATPIVLKLAQGAERQAELRRAAGFPPQTTLRAQLRRLETGGMVEKRRRDRFPGVLEFGLTDAGCDALSVVDVLQRWLDRAPDGPLELGGGAAKAAVKAFADAWSTNMLRALAPGALTLTVLDRVIAGLSYPSLERRLGAMRMAGLLEARPGAGRGTPYAVTEWLRAGVGPLTVAARWERRHRARETRPPAKLDVETGFLLMLPLLRAPSEATGKCRLAAELRNGAETRLAGVTIDVQDGSAVACTTGLERDCDAWAHGPASAWIDAVVERDSDRLELGGDCGLARALADGFNDAAFGPLRASTT